MALSEGDSPSQTVVITSTMSVTVIVIGAGTTLTAVAASATARIAMVRMVLGVVITTNDFVTDLVPAISDHGGITLFLINKIGYVILERECVEQV